MELSDRQKAASIQAIIANKELGPTDRLDGLTTGMFTAKDGFPYLKAKVLGQPETETSKTPELKELEFRGGAGGGGLDQAVKPGVWGCLGYLISFVFF